MSLVNIKKYNELDKELMEKFLQSNEFLNKMKNYML